MRFKNIHITLLLAFFTLKAAAQLSPGDLTRAHADLEGISNCTKCHVLGDKVSNDKCLDCHKEIKTRVSRGAGYHASKEAKGKDCTICHSDHHGRNFDIIRFDKNKFNHNLTGFELTGAHKTIDCRQCHKADYVEDRELKKKPKTYLGLGQKCSSCHEDYHQQTLSGDCAKCHSTTVFAPASKFNHNKTDFPLLGQHKTVDCTKCHQKETRNGKDFQVFAGVKSSNCNTCHTDPHNYNLGTNCKQCHVEQSFTSLAGIKRFDHGETEFPLKGKHRQADCAACHTMNASPTTIFQDRLGLRGNDCARCHEDAHDNKFGSRCAECHNENSFRASPGSLKNFNHARTGFELVGKHTAVDCKKCHTSGSLTTPLKHYTCDACHTDYHEGQMASILGLSPDCSKCHTEQGFETSFFTIADHAKTKFPLNGGHAATPCFACHKKEPEKKWQFRKIGERCVDCHQDIHQGYLDQKFYPDRSCDKCHISSGWVENHFDHNQTRFKLQGAHAKQQCTACHKNDDASAKPVPSPIFANTPMVCSSCHEEAHGRQFEKDGVTECSRCHGFNNWEIPKFNHNKTAFKLEGKHAQVACEKCHKEIALNGELVVQYKFKRFECIDCHQ